MSLPKGRFLTVSPSSVRRFIVDGEVSRRKKTLQTEVVDVLRWLDELAQALAMFSDFEGLPLDFVLEAIVKDGRQLPRGIRDIARDWRARMNNQQPVSPLLCRDASAVGRQLLADLRVGEVGAVQLVEDLARRRMSS